MGKEKEGDCLTLGEVQGVLELHVLHEEAKAQRTTQLQQAQRFETVCPRSDIE